MKADGFQVPAGVKKALAPAIAAASIAAPAFAEGTGEAIGIDDGRLVPCSRGAVSSDVALSLRRGRLRRPFGPTIRTRA